jgi:Ca2+-binding RTX toxin-like protein
MMALTVSRAVRGLTKVMGGEGDDTVDLNGGNDVYYARKDFLASDGNDTVDGGAGIDTYVAISTGTSGITVDLTAGIATGTEFGTDHIENFENVIGTANPDTITGDAGRNMLSGNAGNDSLYGQDGNDRLVGGQGGDTLVGGAGRDVMTGGATVSGGDGARDTFYYNAATDSSPGSTRDWITDFTEGTLATADRIALAAIDANTLVAADQAFAWIGTGAFTGVAGQLRTAVLAGNTYAYADVNGDKAADFSIGLTGTHTLAATDFLL